MSPIVQSSSLLKKIPIGFKLMLTPYGTSSRTIDDDDENDGGKKISLLTLETTGSGGGWIEISAASEVGVYRMKMKL
jgi:hypothetical protein